MNFSGFKKNYQKQEVKEYPNQVDASPVVSVLVQTYQHGNYIGQCLDSILNQRTNFPFEIVLGEDASLDDTREKCIEYAQKYPDKIRLFLHHPDNKIKVMGITTGNFNALYNFFSAKGEYVAFCEGDDLWKDSLKLQRQVDFLSDNKGFALSYHSFKEVDSRGQPYSEKHIINQPAKDLTKEELQQLVEHPLLSTVCFRNHLKEQIPEEMPMVINVDSFLLSILGYYGEARFLETINPSYYRRHQNGIWSNKGKKMKFNSKTLTYGKLRDFYLRNKKEDLAQYFRRKVIQTHKMQFWNSLKSGDIYHTMLCLGKIVRGN